MPHPDFTVELALVEEVWVNTLGHKRGRADSATHLRWGGRSSEEDSIPQSHTPPVRKATHGAMSKGELSLPLTCYSTLERMGPTPYLRSTVELVLEA